MPNTPDARGRILNAAIKSFAEKSFAGSRIDDIAKAANVPKSLIYYHFKSKDNILEVLIQELLSEFKELLAIAKNDNHDDKPKTMKYKLQEHYSGFIKKNVDLIRILLIESLKKDNEIPLIFKIVEELVNGDSKNMKDDASYDLNERLIAEFFTSLVPIYSFFCFQEKWCNYFEINENDLKQIFLNVYEQTHGAYHKNHDEEVFNEREDY